MLPTHSDLAFFQSRQRLPAWANRLESRPSSISTIDCLVASHAGTRTTPAELSAGNLLAIVRSYRRRGLDLAHELERIAQAPGCAIHPEKRARLARKWAARLARGGQS